MIPQNESAGAGVTPEAATDQPTLPAADAEALRSGDAAPVKRVRSRGGKNIILRVFPEEHDDIAIRAAEAGLTISEFIRRIALGHKTQSRFDYDVVEHLLRIHTDMNRLGNLFKMALGQNDAAGGPAYGGYERTRILSTLASIQSNQELLRNYIGEFTA